MLKTNFVPLVKLSVTIIKFFKEGLKRKDRQTEESPQVCFPPSPLPPPPPFIYSPVVDNALVIVSHQRFLVPPLEDMDASLVDGQPEVLG